MSQKKRASWSDVKGTLQLIASKSVDIFNPVELTTLRIFDRKHPGLIRFGYYRVDLTERGMAVIQ